MSRPTKILRFADDTEQRWPGRAPLAGFTIGLTRINASDLATVRAFFASMKGKYDHSFDITLAGVTYEFMAFDQDALEYTEAGEGRFKLTLRLKQVRRNAA